MNVVHINNYNEILGGSEVVMYGEIQGLKSQGHNVYQISVGSSTQRTHDKLVIKGSKAYGVFRLRVFFETLFWLRKREIDLAHVHIYYGKLSNSVIVALRCLKIPVVQSVHEYRRLCPNYKFLDPSGKVCELCATGSIYNSIRKRCIRGSRVKSILVGLEVYLRDKIFNPNVMIDGFIYVSRFIQEKHHHYLGLDFHKVLWNFTNAERISLTKEVKDYDLIYVGRLSREKGVQQLISMLNTNIKLAIVGTGPLSEQIMEHVKLRGNVDYYGFVPNERVKTLMQRSKYLVVPSLWYENNPVIIMEAFSVGLPVIGSDIGGIPEIVQDGKTGFLIDMRNENLSEGIITKALALNNDDYQQLSESSFKFFEDYFTLETHIAGLLEFYGEVLRKKNLKVEK